MKKGFSLIELSIVLVILGLLIGGVLFGQSLVLAAELRSVASDIDRFKTAIYTFYDKYGGIPGDISDATQFWGTSSSCPNGAGTGTQTCDGNGNGRLTVVNPLVFHESARAWQHLANAQLIEGNYTGVQAASTPYFTAGINVPSSKIGGGFSLTEAHGTPTGNFNGAIWTDGTSWGVVLFFGAQHASSFRLPILRPTEAWNIDMKMDDGQPDEGFIMSGRVSGITDNCFTGLVRPAAEYAINNKDISCNLVARFMR